jgi:FixJ family two-component response regulator
MAGAVALAAEHPLHVMIIDVMMPSGSGPQVREKIIALQPGLPVLFMTGHEDGLLEGVDSDLVLRKPFSKQELILAVQRVRATNGTQR